MDELLTDAQRKESAQPLDQTEADRVLEDFSQDNGMTAGYSDGLDLDEFLKDLNLYETAEKEEKMEAKAPVKQASAKEPVKPARKGGAGYVALSVLKGIVSIAIMAACLCVSVQMLAGVFFGSGNAAQGGQSGVAGVTIMDKFDMYMTNQISSALEGVLSIKKVYWLSDNDLVAPEPKEDNYGVAESPEELQWLLDDAAELLNGQSTVFTTETDEWDRSEIQYYLDETIMVITWKQVIDGSVYTISEVKIADPSQFRRFLAGGEWGSDKQYETTEMAESVNAVVASSGDFYKFRQNGIVVYNGQVMRVEGKHADSCFIDDQGNLLFTYRNDILTREAAEQFVEENNIRFSLAFGPVLVDNGKACTPPSYALGEINDQYARAALCQVDELHYLLVTLNGEQNAPNRQDIHVFAKRLQEMGVQKAYALDGGQTAVIAMRGETVNRVEFGYQRKISDIIYFATALPDGE